MMLSMKAFHTLLAVVLAVAISASGFAQTHTKTINVKKTAWVRKAYVTKSGKVVPAKVVHRRTDQRKVSVKKHG